LPRITRESRGERQLGALDVVRMQQVERRDSDQVVGLMSENRAACGGDPRDRGVQCVHRDHVCRVVCQQAVQPLGVGKPQPVSERARLLDKRGQHGIRGLVRRPVQRLGADIEPHMLANPVGSGPVQPDHRPADWVARTQRHQRRELISQ